MYSYMKEYVKSVGRDHDDEKQSKKDTTRVSLLLEMEM